MPVVRDVSWTFEAGTGDAGVTIPMPAYEGDDLLLAFIQSDTGAPTVTATGWAQVFTRSNTCSLTVLRKIATASLEPASVTFAATVNETYNGAIVSIQNVNVANPINVSNDTTQASAAKYAFQAVTTTSDNCLVFCAGANSSVGVPSVIEGPVVSIFGGDGSAESQGIGWTFVPFSGSTDGITTSISCSNVAAGAGVKAVIAINPPATGSLLIPTYCAKDDSIYVDPINGTTAYNSNTALAATAGSSFGTTLNGVAVSNATIAAATDVGLNSFHSVGQYTTVNASANWCGGVLKLATANKPNVAGKNVLVHVGPSTPGQIQRFPAVAANKKGVAFGMRSVTGQVTGSKVFYTHGTGTSWGQSRDVPLVINSSAVTGSVLWSSGSLDATSIDAFGFWVASTGVTTTVWQFYSLWVLDTTTIAGGNVSASVDIKGIINAAAIGHERRSVIGQGVNQALVLQPLQFGNGGTNPIYLDLNATAIEFPQQYNLLSKNVYYCSADNVAGLTYYAGPNDTIKHRNSVISSPSEYHWRIHPSSSLSASYDFSGLSVIGAGDVQLRKVTTFDQMTFAECDTVTQNTASISNCVFNSSFASSSLICDSPNVVSGCSFISAGTGHGIQIITTGTFSFIGNTFTGYGSTGTTDAAVYNNSGGSVTLNIGGGGSTPTYRNGVGASTTINNNVNVTLTGLKNPSEVRVYTAGTQTELAGQENVTGGSFAFSIGSGVSIDISILALGYQNQRILAYSTATDTTLPISQQLDRQYANP